VPEPGGRTPAVLASLQSGVPPPRAHCSSDRAADGVSAETGRGSRPPCCLASSGGFSWEWGGRGGCWVTRGHHVPMSPGAWLAPVSVAWHWPSRAAGAAATGSSPPAPSPGTTQDGPSRSPSLAGSPTGSICVPLSCSKESLGVLQLVSFIPRRRHFRALSPSCCWLAEPAA